MNIDILTEEEIALSKTISLISKTMYVMHTENGIITGISNSKPDGLYLEVEKTRLTDFLSGKKDYYRYTIDYFKFDESLQSKQNTSMVSSALIYDIPRITDTSDIDCVIIHNSIDRRWETVLSDYAKSMLSNINPITEFEFHITALKDPHCLYKTVKIRTLDMINSRTLSFTLDIEGDIDNISVATFGYFRSYGLLAK